MSIAVRNGLIISVFVVITIAALIYGFLFLKTRKLRKKVIDEETKKAHEIILELRGENLGQLPIELEKHLKPKVDNKDLENLINTTYLNKAKNTLVIGEKVEYEYATLNYLGYGNIELLNQNFDVKQWNLAVLDFPQYFPKKPLLIKEINKTYKLIFAINSNLSNQEIFKQYFSLLDEKGMLVVIQNKENKKDLKLMAKILKEQKILYEISHVKNKFLYIVKK
ncbi:BC85_0335 family putative methyltransferase [Mycoplasmopsis columbina]|uniref:Uncharacterized protein n=1 Tax=Mycoplasmopsis columbina SF7 TaxID=1037410 RepID=F9UJT5_9BACT|nr:hypothetical protein [Mycoplasmopsis columbina]EGV00281.1 hypothetical protein MCSF7_00699 [Mycoplasmopsis columbina SF7]VEU76855.1 Uncharacterised protein [Mycoplasmopsis columbina]